LHFHARSERTSIVRGALAVVLLLALVPATAAAALAPVAGPVIDDVPIDPDALRVPSGVSLTSVAGCARGRTLGARRAAVACLVNRARASAGLRGFSGHRALSRAAGRHARDMARARFFAHQRSGGPSLRVRARKAGWRGGRLGEAIAYGCGSSAKPAAIVRSWLASPPHRAILLSTHFSRIGVGIAKHAPVSCRGGKTFVLDAGH
jgi:uncharacterized protein YkwD